MASLRFRFLAAFFAFAALGLLALRFRSTPLATTASLVDPASRSTPGADAGTTLPPATVLLRELFATCVARGRLRATHTHAPH